MKLVLRLALGAMLVFLAGCAGTPMDPATQLAVTNYFPASVEVVRTANFTTGLATMGPEDPEALAERFSDELRNRLAAVMAQHMTGTQPARVVVTLEYASIASGVGRVLVASDSVVGGVVAFVDPVSGATIAAHEIEARDNASRGGGVTVNGIPVGLIAGALINMASAGQDTRIANITEAFIKAVETWLTAPRAS